MASSALDADRHAPAGLDNSEHDALYLRGVGEFNAGHFHECHEVWEVLWRQANGRHRQYFQGLIQAAMALHHLENQNFIGAQKLLIGCRNYLEPYRPYCMGLDVSRFLAEVARRVAWDREKSGSSDAEAPSRPTIRLEFGPKRSCA